MTSVDVDSIVHSAEAEVIVVAVVPVLVDATDDDDDRTSLSEGGMGGVGWYLSSPNALRSLCSRLIRNLSTAVVPSAEDGGTGNDGIEGVGLLVKFSLSKSPC